MNEVEGIRLSEFRQIQERNPGFRGYLIVKIDVAKEKHHAFLG